MPILKALYNINNSITLIQKLYIGFGAILLVFSFVTFTYVSQTRAIRKGIESVNATAEILQLVREVEKHAIDSETGVRGFLVTQDSLFLEPYYNGSQKLPEKIKKLHKLVIDQDQLKRLDHIEKTYERWNSEFGEIAINLQTAALTSPENKPALNAFYTSSIKKGKGNNIMNMLRQQVGVFVVYEQKIRDFRIAQLQRSFLFNNILAVSLTLLCIFAGILIAIMVGNVFKRRLREIATMSREIARGNFSVKIETEQRDEISQVTSSLNLMAEQLNESFSNLSKLNKELDQFAYVVSHDLKAPLRAINSLAEWIEDDLPDVEPDVKRNLKLMRGRVYRMESLINGILTYARIGRKELPESTFSVAALLEEIKDSLNLSDDAVTIESKLPELTTEKILLQQVFTNLISNAFKYNDKPNPHIEIGSVSINNHYEFYVQDNGPGIPAEYHEKVFGVFQTMESRDTRESTGIGLAIVKKIVLEKDGQINLTSTEGEGSRFTFTWPKRQARSKELAL